jgi:LytS/YehU family sensor histidine kinase
MDAPFEVDITPLMPAMELLEIPPLILHPLVENAVKYCSPLQGDTAATLWIEVWMEGNKLVIAVENTSDGKGLSKSIGFGRGLSIVEETLQVNNRLGNKPIRLLRSTPLKHCSQGFRIELWFDEAI